MKGETLVLLRDEWLLELCYSLLAYSLNMIVFALKFKGKAMHVAI